VCQRDSFVRRPAPLEVAWSPCSIRSQTSSDAFFYTNAFGLRNVYSLDCNVFLYSKTCSYMILSWQYWRFPESYRIRQSSFSCEHYKLLFNDPSVSARREHRSVRLWNGNGLLRSQPLAARRPN